MNDHSQYRRVRLSDYLIEQRLGASCDRKIDFYAKIYCGELQASAIMPPASPPSDASMTAVLRHTMRHTNEEREVPALSIPKIKREIEKGALGFDPDLQILKTVTLLSPVAATVTNALTTAVQREVAHKQNVLAAIKELGYEPMKLPRANGNAGVKKQVKDFMGKRISDGAFKKAWQALRDEGSIKDA